MQREPTSPGSAVLEFSTSTATPDTMLTTPAVSLKLLVNNRIRLRPRETWIPSSCSWITCLTSTASRM